METKRCSRGDNCVHPDGPYLPIAEFSKYKSRRDGLTPYCKFCARWYNSDYSGFRGRSFWTIRASNANKNSYINRVGNIKGEFKKNVKYGSHTRNTYVGKAGRGFWNGRARLANNIVAGSLDRSRLKYNVKGTITGNELMEQHDKQQACCAYCGILFMETPEQNFSIDHLLAISKGGEHKIHNIRLVCKKCNDAKNAQTLQETVEWAERFLRYQYANKKVSQVKEIEEGKLNERTGERAASSGRDSRRVNSGRIDGAGATGGTD